MGWKSLAYCLCFTWRDPEGTKAQPNLWGKETRLSETQLLIWNYSCKVTWVNNDCEAKGAYCSAGGEHAVEHVTSQSDTHHQVDSIPVTQVLMSIHNIRANNISVVIINLTARWQTYPTPMRYRGFSRGRWSVLSVTIRQKSSFSSPPLRPPMAKPGTSRWVISKRKRIEYLKYKFDPLTLVSDKLITFSWNF